VGRQTEIPAPDLTGAVRGDKRAALEAIRDRLAAELTRARGQAAAAVAKELRATIDAIEALPGGEVSAVDDLAAKREKRRADAASR
jgi:molecular chaperone GrpE (heat shock protein)